MHADVCAHVCIQFSSPAGFFLMLFLMFMKNLQVGLLGLGVDPRMGNGRP